MMDDPPKPIPIARPAIKVFWLRSGPDWRPVRPLLLPIGKDEWVLVLRDDTLKGVEREVFGNPKLPVNPKMMT
jgi:hypothetical protein